MLVIHVFCFSQPPKKDSKASAKQPQKTQKKKEGSGGGKAKKKVFLTIINIIFVTYCWNLQKWSKGKVRDKLNNQVLFDKATYDKLYKEVPSYKLITPSVVSERLKVRGSLARRALIELQQKGESLFGLNHQGVFFNMMIDLNPENPWRLKLI